MLWYENTGVLLQWTRGGEHSVPSILPNFLPTRRSHCKPPSFCCNMWMYVSAHMTTLWAGARRGKNLVCDVVRKWELHSFALWGMEQFILRKWIWNIAIQLKVQQTKGQTFIFNFYLLLHLSDNQDFPPIVLIWLFMPPIKAGNWTSAVHCLDFIYENMT